MTSDRDLLSIIVIVTPPSQLPWHRHCSTEPRINTLGDWIVGDQGHDDDGDAFPVGYA